MARGLLRAAAYLPSWTDGHRRVGGFDEDELTFAATAIERAVPAGAPRPRNWTVRLVGYPAGREPAELASLLGGPSTWTAVPEGPTALSTVLDRAMAGPGAQLVVVVARGSGVRVGAAGRGPPSEGAIAYYYDEGEGVAALPSPAPPAREDGGLGPLLEEVRRHRGPGTESLLPGDWEADPRRGRPIGPATTGAAAPPTVSEGAYVPPARYEEGLASRWRFLAERCPRCGVATFPARGRCRGCGAVEGLEELPLPLDGARVVAATWIGRGGQPTEFDLQVEAQGAYGVVLAEVTPEVRVTLQVAEGSPEEMGIGSSIATRLRRLYPLEGRWRYGRKAVPLSAVPRPG